MSTGVTHSPMKRSRRHDLVGISILNRMTRKAWNRRKEKKKKCKSKMATTTTTPERKTQYKPDCRIVSSYMHTYLLLWQRKLLVASLDTGLDGLPSLQSLGEIMTEDKKMLFFSPKLVFCQNPKQQASHTIQFEFCLWLAILCRRT